MTFRPDELRDFGLRVRRAREGRRWSQMQLSYASGLHSTYVGGIERGERNPTFLTILKLARGLDMTVGDLLDDRRLPA